jgi:beta-phosphoglucomutase
LLADKVNVTVTINHIIFIMSFTKQLLMLKSFIFDMDGVLVDSMPYHVDAWITVFSEININISSQDIYNIEGSNYKGLINLAFNKAGRTPKLNDFKELSRKKELIFKKINKLKPFDGMVECLNKLKEQYSLGVVSGSDRKIVHWIIDKFFPGLFDVIVSGEDVDEGKPSPEPYLKAVKMLNIKQDECIVIENAPLGVESAKNAGLYCVAVPTYVEPQNLKKADLVLNDHIALRKYLECL